LSDFIYVAADNEEMNYDNKYVNYDNETSKTLIKIIVENDYYSRVNEGFYFLILRNSSDFDDFFLNVCIYILFEIRNILVGAR
jgi:hypothetical protein